MSNVIDDHDSKPHEAKISYFVDKPCPKCGGTTFDELGCRRCQSAKADLELRKQKEAENNASVEAPAEKKLKSSKSKSGT